MRIARLPGFLFVLVFAVLCGLFTSSAFAANNPERTQFGHTIHVDANEQMGDVTCIGCSIYIRGQVAGDATTVGGSIFLEDQGQVAGDVTTVAGNIRLASGAKVAGDTTTVGGEIRRAPGAQISGDVTAIGGVLWVPLILLFPFVVLGLLVWLIVWLVQRSRQPSVPAASDLGT